MDKLDNLLFLALDSAGQKKTMTLTDSLRLVVSGYKLGYQDGVNDSKEIVINDQKESSTKESPSLPA